MTRKQITRLTVKTVLIFLLAAFLLGTLIHFSSQILSFATATALEKGNTDLARVLAGRMSEEDSADYLTECDYQDACRLMDAGDYEAAAASFSALGDYSDARESAQYCVYRQAAALMQEEQWAEAAELYLSLGSYNDSAAQYNACIYREAQEAAENGNTSEAVFLYLSVSDYQDSLQLAGDLACSVTGLTDPDAAINALRGLSEEDLENISQLAALRAGLTPGKIAAGFHHTVGLKADGTVVACGDDSYGQCDTGAMTDIIYVCAGAYHTVGLRADGTVTAVGRNAEGQCDTGSWSGIIAVAATDYGTLGLRTDGSVVYSGYNSSFFPDNWSSVASICGGSYDYAAIRSDGTVLFSHETERKGDWNNVVDLTVNTAFAVGVTAAGDVISPELELPGWDSLLAVSSSGTGILGINKEHELLSYWFRPSFSIDLSGISGATAVSTRGTHVAVLLEDGSVVARGDNSYGQCDTGSWALG